MDIGRSRKAFHLVHNHDQWCHMNDQEMQFSIVQAHIDDGAGTTGKPTAIYCQDGRMGITQDTTAEVLIKLVYCKGFNLVYELQFNHSDLTGT